jgi:hypothetical protein
LPAEAEFRSCILPAKDTVATWVNGKQESSSSPGRSGITFLAYLFIYDITNAVHRGSNTLAAEVLNYDGPRTSATLFSATSNSTDDGKIVTYKTNPEGWKTSSTPADGWNTSEFDDSSWPAAEVYSGRPASAVEVAGHPGRRARFGSSQELYVSKQITFAEALRHRARSLQVPHQWKGCRRSDPRSRLDGFSAVTFRIRPTT